MVLNSAESSSAGVGSDDKASLAQRLPLAFLWNGTLCLFPCWLGYWFKLS